MTRILVNIRYENEVAVIKKENGDTLRISNGDKFKTPGQISSYIATKQGKFIKLCRRSGSGKPCFDEQGREEGEIVREGNYLMATTPGSAANGIFHRFHEPKDALERVIFGSGKGAKIISTVDTIDMEFGFGGDFCSHSTRASSYDKVTADGKISTTEEPPTIQGHSNQYHNGCYCGTGTKKVEGGTYAISHSVGQHPNGMRYREINRVVLTPEAGRDVVASIVEKILKGE